MGTWKGIVEASFEAAEFDRCWHALADDAQSFNHLLGSPQLAIDAAKLKGAPATATLSAFNSYLKKNEPLAPTWNCCATRTPPTRPRTKPAKRTMRGMGGGRVAIRPRPRMPKCASKLPAHCFGHATPGFPATPTFFSKT